MHHKRHGRRVLPSGGVVRERQDPRARRRDRPGTARVRAHQVAHGLVHGRARRDDTGRRCHGND